MLKVTHRNVFVSQKVCRHPSFSVWTRAWTWTWHEFIQPQQQQYR